MRSLFYIQFEKSVSRAFLRHVAHSSSRHFAPHRPFLRLYLFLQQADTKIPGVLSKAYLIFILVWPYSHRDTWPEIGPFFPSHDRLPFELTPATRHIGYTRLAMSRATTIANICPLSVGQYLVLRNFCWIIASGMIAVTMARSKPPTTSRQSLVRSLVTLQ